MLVIPPVPKEGAESGAADGQGETVGCLHRVRSAVRNKAVSHIRVKCSLQIQEKGTCPSTFDGETSPALRENSSPVPSWFVPGRMRGGRIARGDPVALGIGCAIFLHLSLLRTGMAYLPSPLPRGSFSSSLALPFTSASP